jgi:hypothetical protein
MEQNGLDSAGSEMGQVAGSYEHSNKEKEISSKLWVP